MITGRNYGTAGSIATTPQQTTPASFLKLRIVDGKNVFSFTTPPRQQKLMRHLLDKLSISEMNAFADFVFGEPDAKKGGLDHV